MVFGRLPPRRTRDVGKRRPGLESFVMLKFKQPGSGGKSVPRAVVFAE